MSGGINKALPLTIGGHLFYIPFKRWFFYTGTLRSAPPWFIDLVEELSPTRLPTGVLAFHNLANGSVDIHPNELVFHTTTSVVGKTLHILSTLRAVETEHVSEASPSSVACRD